MEKIANATPDIIQENIEKIAELFPDCVTEVLDAEGRPKRAIDFDALKGNLSGEVAEGMRERYQFSWPGKAQAKLEARKPCTKTMRPCPEESVNWDTTENLYIEGDNLEALKIMRETYAGKIKLIYIDPPYNTGHDFIYDDDFAKARAEYEEESGDFDEEGGRLVANPESNGRFHSDWCSMMYPRLLLARDLLRDDGVIFISIDDNESKNLRVICDEVFGGTNFVTDVIWKHTQQSKNDERHFSRQYNHTIVFAKNKDELPGFLLERTEEHNKAYSNPDNDPKGPWRSGDVRSPNFRKTLCYDIVAPDRTVIKHPSNGWRWSEESLKEKLLTGEIIFKPDNSGIIRKIYLRDQAGRVPENLWDGPEYGTTRQAAALIKELFDGIQVFDTPKPIELIMKMLEITKGNNNSIIMDFFSGSASTAHATLAQSVKDGIKRRFILVQMPEDCNKSSAAYHAGYENVSEIAKERIRRAGAKIAVEVEEANKQLQLGEEPKAVPDIGFRVLKIDSSNFRETYLEPGEVAQDKLDLYIDNLKDDRTAEDLLFQVLPAFRIPYSAKIETFEAAGKTVYNVNEGQLLACFDEEVDVATIEDIAKRKPVYAVLRDASLKDDATEANFEELFKTYSPGTIRRVI